MNGHGKVAGFDYRALASELGARTHPLFIGGLFVEAELDAAIPAAAIAVFGASGQVCVARSRLFIEQSLFDEVIRGIIDFAAGPTAWPGGSRQAPSK